MSKRNNMAIKTPARHRKKSSKKSEITFVFLPVQSIPTRNVDLVFYRLATFTGYYDRNFVAGFVSVGNNVYSATPENGVRFSHKNDEGLQSLRPNPQLPQEIQPTIIKIQVTAKQKQKIEAWCEGWAQYNKTPDNTAIQDNRMQFGRILPQCLSTKDTCVLPAEFLFGAFKITEEGSKICNQYKGDPRFMTLSQMHDLVTKNK